MQIALKHLVRFSPTSLRWSATSWKFILYTIKSREGSLCRCVFIFQCSLSLYFKFSFIIFYGRLFIIQIMMWNRQMKKILQGIFLDMLCFSIYGTRRNYYTTIPINRQKDKLTPFLKAFSLQHYTFTGATTFAEL